MCVVLAFCVSVAFKVKHNMTALGERMLELAYENYINSFDNLLKRKYLQSIQTHSHTNSLEYTRIKRDATTAIAAEVAAAPALAVTATVLNVRLCSFTWKLMFLNRN